MDQTTLAGSRIDDLSGAQKNGGLIAPSPSKQDPSKVRIISVGDLGGGTTYFSEKNIVGLYKQIELDMANKEPPDHIIFNGEVLPEIPAYITRGGRSKMLVLGDLITDLDHAAVYMKQHMARIVEIANSGGNKCGISYVISESDKANIINTADMLTSVYDKNKPQRIAGLMYATLEKVEVERRILRKLLEQEGRNKARNVSNSELSKKIAIQREIVADFGHISEKYVELVKLWIKEHDKLQVEDLFKIFKKYITRPGFTDIIFESLSPKKQKDAIRHLEQEYEAVTRIINGLQAGASSQRGKMDDFLGQGAKSYQDDFPLRGALKPKNRAKLSEFIAHARFLQDELKRQVAYDLRHQEKKAIDEQFKGVSEMAIRQFVNILPGSKSLAVLVGEIAAKEHCAKIKYIFNNHSNFRIIDTKEAVLEIKGLKVMVVHKPEGGSTQFSKKSEKGLEHMVYTCEQKLDLVISAHSFKGFETLIPRRNRSKEYTYLVTLPPLVDRQKLKEAANRHLRTPFTSASEKIPMSSGVYKLTHDGYGFTSTFYTSEHLKVLESIDRHEQLGLFKSMLSALRPEQIQKSEIDNKDRLEIRGSRLSELSDRQISTLMVDNGLDPLSKSTLSEIKVGIRNRQMNLSSEKVNAFLEKILPTSLPDHQLKALNIVTITDTHVGSSPKGIPITDKLDGASEYVRNAYSIFLGKDGKHYSKTPFVLVLLGDLIEGDLRGHKYELTTENNHGNIEEFKKHLELKGLRKDSVPYRENLQQYKSLVFDGLPITNFDVQAKLFIDKIKTLAEAAQHVVVVSGNHMNRSASTPGAAEEAEKVGNLLAASVGQEKVIKISGGDYGLATLHIDGKPFFISHKPHRDPIGAVNKSGVIGSRFYGDQHVARKNIVGNTFELMTPALQSPTDFAESVGIAVSESINGFSISTLLFGPKSDNPAISSTKFVTVDEMLRKNLVANIREANPLIREFESGKRKIETKQSLRVAIAT